MSKINYGYDINDCPMCGNPVELDGGSATECYGWAWQTLYIRCTDIKDKNCNMELNLTADMNYIVEQVMH